MSRAGSVAVASVLLVLFGLPSVALAAPTLIASEPEDGATMHQPVEEVVLTFDMPLDPATSALVVVDECGRRIDDKDPEVLANRMSVSLAKNPSGVYEVRYRATPPAGATGSTSGAISFTVHPGKPCGDGAVAQGGHGAHGGGPDGDGKHGHRSGEGAGHPGGGHSTSEHSGATHGTSGPGAAAHSPSVHETSQHSGRSGDRSAGGHGKGHGGASTVSAAPPIAAPGIPSLAGAQVPASTIATSLALCLALGLLGGWFVRNSGAR